MQLQRTLLRFAALVLLVSIGLFFAACGDDGGGGTNDDTASDSAVDTNVDTQQPDTSQPDQDTTTGGRDLYAPMNAVFTYRDPEAPGDPVSVYVVANDAGVENLRQSDLALLSQDIDCAGAQCWVTDDLAWFIMLIGAGELRIGPISAGPSVTFDSLDLVANDVSQVEVKGTRIAYVMGNQAHFLDLSGGLTVPTVLGTVSQQLGDGVDYVGAGIALAPSGDYLLIYRYDLSSLGVWAVPVAGGAERLVYRFGMPRLSGSFFTSDNPFVVTSDGTAVMLLEGMILHHTCETDVGCDDIPEASCSFFIAEGVQSSTGLCSANQRAFVSFALEPSDLGQDCASDADCDPRHRCITDPSSLITGARTVCAPGELVLGPKSTSVCAILADGQYPDVGRTLRLTEDGKVLFLAMNDCGAFNISQNAVVSVDADLSAASLSVVEGFYEQDFGQQYCYDEQEGLWTYADCAIEIQDFDLSPGGGLLLRGSAPDDRLGRELWAFDEDGDKYPLTNDIFYDVNVFHATAR